MGIAMKKYTGKSVFAGVAIGKVMLYDKGQHHRRCNENHQITDGAIPTLKRKAVSYMQETAFLL